MKAHGLGGRAQSVDQDATSGSTTPDAPQALDLRRHRRRRARRRALDEHIQDRVDAILGALAPGDEEARGFDASLDDLLNEANR